MRGFSAPPFSFFSWKICVRTIDTYRHPADGRNAHTVYWLDLLDERADRADLNNDHEVNVLDASIVGTEWMNTAWR